MPAVEAVSVSPTWEVPLMVGAPWACEFCRWVGPGNTTSSLLDNILLSPVQMAPCASQSVVTGSTMVTSLLEVARPLSATGCCWAEPGVALPSLCPGHRECVAAQGLVAEPF